MNTSKLENPLPNVRRHLRYFIIGILGYILIAFVGSKFPNAPAGLLILLGIPCWIAVVVPFFGYFVVYPFLHLTGRYEGQSRQAWIVWLVLDTVGLTFGLVRFLYYLTEIIPDFRRARTDRIKPKNGAITERETLTRREPKAP